MIIKDEDFSVATYEFFGAIKEYSYLTFQDLYDLIKQLKERKYSSVHLRVFGEYDDYGKIVLQNILVDDIQKKHIDWCNSVSSSGNRYLELSKG